MMQKIVLLVVVAGILIFAAFLWMLYLVKLVSNEEELNEKIRIKQRQREEQRRKKNDTRRHRMEEKKKSVETVNVAMETDKGPAKDTGDADKSNKAKTERSAP